MDYQKFEYITPEGPYVNLKKGAAIGKILKAERDLDFLLRLSPKEFKSLALDLLSLSDSGGNFKK